MWLTHMPLPMHCIHSYHFMWYVSDSTVISSGWHLLSDSLFVMWHYTSVVCLSCFCLQEDMYVMRKVWVRSCQQELWFCVLCRIVNEEDIDSRINWVRCIHLLNVCTGCSQTALYGHLLIEIIVHDFLMFVQDPKVLTLNTHPCLTIIFLPCSSTITLWVFRSEWG